MIACIKPNSATLGKKILLEVYPEDEPSKVDARTFDSQREAIAMVRILEKQIGQRITIESTCGRWD